MWINNLFEVFKDRLLYENGLKIRTARASELCRNFNIDLDKG